MQKQQRKTRPQQKYQNKQPTILRPPLRLPQLDIPLLHRARRSDRILEQLVRQFRLLGEVGDEFHLEGTDVHEAGFGLVDRFEGFLDGGEDGGVFGLELEDLGGGEVEVVIV